MRQLEERFLVTFATTTGAMAMEKCCKERGVPGRLIPVPRSITAGCGMCWMAPLAAREAVENLVLAEHLDISGLFVKLL